MVNQDALPPEGDFYIVMRRQGKTIPIAGPFADIRETIGANKKRALDEVCEIDPMSWFNVWGSQRVERGRKVKTVLQMEEVII